MPKKIVCVSMCEGETKKIYIYYIMCGSPCVYYACVGGPRINKTITTCDGLKLTTDCLHYVDNHAILYRVLLAAVGSSGCLRPAICVACA